MNFEKIKVVDSEVRVLHPQARDPDFKLASNEPVRRVIYDHPDFGKIVDKLSVEAVIQSMDESDISYGLLSGLAWHCIDTLNENNEYVSECVGSNPNKFRALYIIDTTDPDRAAQEVENLDQSIFVGVEIIPKWQKVRIDDPILQPIFDAVVKKDLFLKVYTAHPHQTLDGDTPFRLLNVLRENRELKVLIPHLGGLIGLYGLLPEIAALLKNAYFITSVSSTMKMVKFAAEVNVDNLLFGTDFPFNHCHDQVSPLKELFQLPIDEDGKSKILGKTAANLFGFEW